MQRGFILPQQLPDFETGASLRDPALLETVQIHAHRTLAKLQIISVTRRHEFLHKSNHASDPPRPVHRMARVALVLAHRVRNHVRQYPGKRTSTCQSCRRRDSSYSTPITFYVAISLRLTRKYCIKHCVGSLECLSFPRSMI